MKIEVTACVPAHEAPRGDGRGEAHIRVLTDDMVGPEIWSKVEEKLLAGSFFDNYERKFERFYPELTQLEEGEMDYDGYQHEQWFVVAAQRDRG